MGHIIHEDIVRLKDPNYCCAAPIDTGLIQENI